MTLRTTILLDAAAVTEETDVEFYLAGAQVPATLSCNGVAATGEDIAIQKNVADKNGDNWITVTEAGADKVLNGNNTAVAIYGPGHYRIQTANVTYASGDVSVVIDF